MAVVTIIDYGIGNVGSILNMYRKLAIPAQIGIDGSSIATAERLILPGVGAFDACMEALHSSALRQPVLDAVSRGVPLLGICVGMQMLMLSSDEGSSAGLGLIPGRVRRFPESDDLKVPHMGWNNISWTRQHPLSKGLSDRPRFYFVHSYHAVCEDAGHVLAECNYGDRFTAGVAFNKVLGVQFHPEKSHRFGIQLLKNFANL